MSTAATFVFVKRHRYQFTVLRIGKQTTAAVARSCGATQLSLRKNEDVLARQRFVDL
jgi:hypothetical protein